MEIRTAGQQKYYDFIEDRVKSLRLGMIIWISLLAVAILAVLAGSKLGFALGILGAALGILNIRSQKALNSKLEKVGDKEEFFNQLIAADTVDIPDYRLIITKDYVLQYRSEVLIFPLKEMEKVEVGIREQGSYRQKKLFLTEASGERHEMAACNHAEQEKSFDLAYRALRDKLRY